MIDTSIGKNFFKSGLFPFFFAKTIFKQIKLKKKFCKKKLGVQKDFSFLKLIENIRLKLRSVKNFSDVIMFTSIGV